MIFIYNTRLLCIYIYLQDILTGQTHFRVCVVYACMYTYVWGCNVAMGTVTMSKVNSRYNGTVRVYTDLLLY